MVELAESKNGIFYDESTNKKIMNEIQKTKKRKQKMEILSPQHAKNNQKEENLFRHFNFN